MAQEKNINLTLNFNLNEVNLVLSALGEMKASVSIDLILKIKSMAMSQVNNLEVPEAAVPEAVKEVPEESTEEKV